MKLRILLFMILAAVLTATAGAPAAPEQTVTEGATWEVVEIARTDSLTDVTAVGFETSGMATPQPIDVNLDFKPRHNIISPYALPYQHGSSDLSRDWHRMWINTAVLSGAYVGTLFVLELLPEDATAWNRAAIQQTPMFTRWFQNVFKKGPEWDHDNPIFNYVLHPYAGAAYYMAARSCGFSLPGSLLYSFLISTVGWEFGIEAFMERPSYQDLIITPCVGSLIGEMFYLGKRTIVENGYELFGSQFLGRAACFILDPVNEVVDLFRGNPARRAAERYRKPRVSGSLAITPRSLTLTVNF